jgi:hypothetical protein
MDAVCLWKKRGLDDEEENGFLSIYQRYGSFGFIARRM